MIINFLHFLLSQKGNRKVDPMVPQEAPNSGRQQSEFERSLSFAIHSDYAKRPKVTTDENTVITY